MHRGVTDWTGLPYVTHPIWVMMNIPSKCSDDDRHLALLHDVVEDCQDRLYACIPTMPRDLTSIFSSLRINYSDYVVQGLSLLTRDLWQDMTYLDYVQNIAASGHLGAIWVKYTDNLHNSDPFRCERLPLEYRERSIQMNRRYERSKEILRDALKKADANYQWT